MAEHYQAACGRTFDKDVKLDAIDVDFTRSHDDVDGTKEHLLALEGVGALAKLPKVVRTDELPLGYDEAMLEEGRSCDR